MVNRNDWCKLENVVQFPALTTGKYSRQRLMGWFISSSVSHIGQNECSSFLILAIGWRNSKYPTDISSSSLCAYSSIWTWNRSFTFAYQYIFSSSRERTILKNLDFVKSNKLSAINLCNTLEMSGGFWTRLWFLSYCAKIAFPPLNRSWLHDWQYIIVVHSVFYDLHIMYITWKHGHFCIGVQMVK